MDIGLPDILLEVVRFNRFDIDQNSLTCFVLQNLLQSEFWWDIVGRSRASGIGAGTWRWRRGCHLSLLVCKLFEVNIDRFLVPLQPWRKARHRGNGFETWAQNCNSFRSKSMKRKVQILIPPSLVSQLFRSMVCLLSQRKTAPQAVHYWWR